MNRIMKITPYFLSLLAIFAFAFVLSAKSAEACCYDYYSTNYYNIAPTYIRIPQTSYTHISNQVPYYQPTYINTPQPTYEQPRIYVSTPVYNSYPVYPTVQQTYYVYNAPQPVYRPVVQVPPPAPVLTPVVPAQPVVGTSGLDIGCFADPAKIKVNQPVTWVAEVIGGFGPYTYSWSGSEGLSGTQSSVIKYYDKVGTKNAVVTVTSADGRVATRACSTAVTVQSTVTKAKVVKKTPAPVVEPTQTPSQVSASSMSNFSLGNIPWAWVAIIIILILFITVVYLIVNKDKI